jgi:hypothetical protein
VTAPRRRSRPGLITHRSTTLTAHDLRRRHGIRVTSPLRTVLDLQPGVSDHRLVRLVNDLRTRKHLRATAFNELCTRSVRIHRLLGDGGLTESELEDLFRRFVTRHRLPMPELTVWRQIAGRWRRLDAFYPEAGLIVELDSWQFHGDRASFERDRAKDAAALARGCGRCEAPTGACAGTGARRPRSSAGSSPKRATDGTGCVRKERPLRQKGTCCDPAGHGRARHPRVAAGPAQAHIAATTPQQKAPPRRTGAAR